MDEQEIREFWKNVQLGDYLTVQYKVPMLERTLRNFDRALLAFIPQPVPRIDRKNGYVIRMDVYAIVLFKNDPGKDHPVKEKRLAAKGIVGYPRIRYVDVLEYKKETFDLEAKVS